MAAICPSGWCPSSRTSSSSRRRRRRQDGHSHAGRSDHPGAWQRHAQGEVPAPHPHRRGYLVPAVQRAGQRLRSRRRHDAGRAPRQQVGDQRPEGLDDERASRRLRSAAGAHQHGRAQAHRASPIFIIDMHQPGVEVVPLQADERARLVQSGVHHRCRDRAGIHGGEGRRRLEDRDDDADARAPRRRRHAALCASRKARPGTHLRGGGQGDRHRSRALQVVPAAHGPGRSAHRARQGNRPQYRSGRAPGDRQGC